MVPPGKNPSAASSGDEAGELHRGKSPDIEDIKRLAVRGMSASEIGRELGCSRNAVIGKAWRAGVELANLNGSRTAEEMRRRRLEFLGARPDLRKAWGARMAELRRAGRAQPEGKPVDAVPRSEGTPPPSPSQPQSQETM